MWKQVMAHTFLTMSNIKTQMYSILTVQKKCNVHMEKLKLDVDIIV